MSYQAPLRDMRFVLHELFDAADHCERLGNGLDRELIDGVLEEAAAFAAGEVAPLNRNPRASPKPTGSMWTTAGRA
jgi:hypothetical protein